MHLSSPIAHNSTLPEIPNSCVSDNDMLVDDVIFRSFTIIRYCLYLYKSRLDDPKIPTSEKVLFINDYNLFLTYLNSVLISIKNITSQPDNKLLYINLELHVFNLKKILPHISKLRRLSYKYTASFPSATLFYGHSLVYFTPCTNPAVSSTQEIMNDLSSQPDKPVNQIVIQNDDSTTLSSAINQFNHDQLSSYLNNLFAKLELVNKEHNFSHNETLKLLSEINMLILSYGLKNDKVRLVKDILTTNKELIIDIISKCGSSTYLFTFFTKTCLRFDLDFISKSFGFDFGGQYHDLALANPSLSTSLPVNDSTPIQKVSKPLLPKRLWKSLTKKIKWFWEKRL